MTKIPQWVIDAVSWIEADICDRRGLRQEWEKIDTITKEEIRLAWATLIANSEAYATERQGFA